MEMERMEGRMNPTIIMVFAQVLFAGINVCYALAVENGMDLSVLVAYRFIVGALFLLPFAFFRERNKRSKMTWKVVLYAFLCGIFGGSLGQNLFLASLVYTSATYAAALVNLVPAFTFVMAVCWRVEKLRWNSTAGKAKVLGTLIGIGGATIFTLYKGREVFLWKTKINLMKLVANHSTKAVKRKHGRNDQVLGLCLSLLSCMCYSFWFVLQAKAAAIYPYPQSFTSLMLVSAAIQSTIVAACVQHDRQQWILGWNIRLLTVIYAGVIGSGIFISIIAYCVRVRGPLFGSIFSPLLLVLVAIAGSLFMGENLSIGRILGGIVIVAGLYIVLWGKSKEMKLVNNYNNNNGVVPKDDDSKVQVKKEEEESSSTSLAEISVVSLSERNQTDSRSSSNKAKDRGSNVDAST